MMIDRTILDELGWTPNRKVNITDIKTYLEKAGYFWSPKVQEFLEEFAFLEMKRFHFDVLKADKEIDSSWILDNYAKRLHDYSLCLIGQAYNDHLTIFMNSEGRVYGGFDDILYFIGDTFESAIKNIYTEGDFIEI